MRAEQEVLDTLNAIPAITAVRTVAGQQSVPVYLAGGALRDLFLGLPPQDFDFIVEADARDFARQLATLAPGAVGESAPDSGTVRYRSRKLGRLDFMPAGGLSVDEFLTRYFDFTVNTLVFDLQRGTIVDSHGSLADIDDQTIRNVPSTGFASKPAHFLLRAIRLALLTPTFTLDAGTRAGLEAHRQLVTSADAADVGYELNAILKSTEYLRGIRLLSDLGMLQEILDTFLPCAAPASGHDDATRGADIDEVIRLFSMLDDVSAPCLSLVSRHLPVLRDVILVTAQMRRNGLQVTEEAGRRFLVTQGSALEETFNNLSTRFSPLGLYGFRVRMVTIGYWLGMASLSDRTASIEAVIESSIRTFGRRKGLLSALLIGADWLVHAGHDTTAGGHAESVKAIFQRIGSEDGLVSLAAQ